MDSKPKPSVRVNRIDQLLLTLSAFAVLAAITTWYYQANEIEHYNTAAKLVKLERGVAKWEKQVARTKLVGTKVAKQQARYKGELAYLNDLQSQFWAKISKNKTILADNSGSQAARRLGKHAEYVMDAWSALEQYHEALLINEPNIKHLDRTAYKAYRNAIAGFHEQVSLSIITFKAAAELDAYYQNFSIAVFICSFLGFFVIALAPYVIGLWQRFRQSTSAEVSFSPLMAEYPTESAKTANQVWAINQISPIFEQSEGALAHRMASTPENQGHNIDDFTNSTFGNSASTSPTNQNAVQEDYLQQTTVYDFGQLAQNNELVAAEVEFDGEQIPDALNLEVEPTFLGFDLNNKYFALPKADASGAYQELAQPYMGEPIAPFSLNHEANELRTEKDELAKPVAFNSPYWFEFTLTPDLMISGTHPVWVSPKGYASLGYENHAANNFAKLVDLFHPDERFTFLQSLRLQLQTDKIPEDLSMTCRLKGSNGIYHGVIFQVIIERNKKGQPQKVKGFWNELEPPVRYAYNEIDLQLGDLTWEMPATIMLAEHDMCTWSDQFAGLLGYAPFNMPLTALQVRSIIHPDDLQGFADSVHTLLASPNQIERFTWQLRLRNAYGGYTGLSLEGIVLLNAYGQIYRFGGIVTAILQERVDSMPFFATYSQRHYPASHLNHQQEEAIQRFIIRQA